MMVGLQGSENTSVAAGKFVKKENHAPLLVAADVYRPAAIKQLQVLGEQLNVPFPDGTTKSGAIAKAALEQAKKSA